MKKLFHLLALGLLYLSAASVQADTLVPPTTPDTNFEATVNLTSGNISLALLTPETWAVLDPLNNLVGPVAGLVASTPDLLTVNLPTPSQVVDVKFASNVSNPGVSLDTGTGLLTIPALGSVAVGPVNDPGLSRLLGGSQFVFSLDAANSTSTSLAFDFDAAQISTPTSTPEPTALLPAGFGLLALAGFRLRKRNA